MRQVLALLRMIVIVSICTVAGASNAQGVLENPVAGSIESGIGIVSGWHCTASQIRVTIDGVDLGTTGVGSIRNDTAGICGHANRRCGRPFACPRASSAR